jgi:hemolysin III
MSKEFPDYRPYSSGEVAADAAVHAVGVVGSLAAGLALLARLRADHGAFDIAVVGIYLAALLTVFALSAGYNLTPPSALKWRLRRFDQAAIFLLIAATYTPLLPFLPESRQTWGLGLFVWLGCAAGATLKLTFPNRFDRPFILFYLALGWSGVAAAPSFAAALPAGVMALIIAGGILYTAGVLFHLWDELRYQNAVWHTFVVLAAACHFAAVALLYG